ncbi:MAG: ArsR/SmtB family transcription factor [Planctomycetota bacterium]
MENAIQSLFKLLADENRLRLLVLLEDEELAVQEIVAATGLGQSTVSHHLALLRSAGLIQDRREGTWTFHRLARPGHPGALKPELWGLVREYLHTELAQKDRAERQRVLAARRERTRVAHDRLAGDWRRLGEDLEHGSLRAEVLAALVAPGLVVADLGCGAGFLTRYLSGRVGRVIAVDQSAAMLQEARNTPGANARVEYRQGELHALPIDTGEVQAVLANLVLHHIADFNPVLREIARILRPGGMVVISDLRPHREEWMREDFADLRLGIDPEELVRAFDPEVFGQIEEIPVEDRYRMKGPGGRCARLELFMIRAVKHSDQASLGRAERTAGTLARTTTP